jgi:hypothetical protein
MTDQPDELLPGEAAPLPMTIGGPPVSDAEVLGVWRRWVRQSNERLGRDEELPTALPLPNPGGKTPMWSFRIPLLRMLRARARADREGRSLADVISDFLELYGTSEIGSQPKMVVPSAGGPRRSRRGNQ